MFRNQETKKLCQTAGQSTKPHEFLKVTGMAVRHLFLHSAGMLLFAFPTLSLQKEGVDLDDPRAQCAGNSILRKEVIHPQLPLRMPCYDFVPVTSPTVGSRTRDFGYCRLP